MQAVSISFIGSTTNKNSLPVCFQFSLLVPFCKVIILLNVSLVKYGLSGLLYKKAFQVFIFQQQKKT